jgi:hypothetical protein
MALHRRQFEWMNASGDRAEPAGEIADGEGVEKVAEFREKRGDFAAQLEREAVKRETMNRGRSTGPRRRRVESCWEHAHISFAKTRDAIENQTRSRSECEYREDGGDFCTQPLAG